MMRSFLRFISGDKSERESPGVLLQRDPVGFLARYAVNAFHMYPPEMSKRDLNREADIYRFSLDWVPGHDEVVLQVHLNGDVAAYLLQYNQYVQSKADVPSVLLPKRDPEAMLMLTPALTGCTVVVEDEGDYLRVYHDSRPYQEDEYENVMGVIHPDMMQRYDGQGSPLETAGFAMMYYDQDNGWHLLGQALQLAELDRERGLQHFDLNRDVDNPLTAELGLSGRSSRPG